MQLIAVPWSIGDMNSPEFGVYHWRFHSKPAAREVVILTDGDGVCWKTMVVGDRVKAEQFYSVKRIECLGETAFVVPLLRAIGEVQ